MSEEELKKMTKTTAGEIRAFLIEADKSSAQGLIEAKEFSEGFVQVKIGQIVVEGEDGVRWDEVFVEGPGKIFRMVITSEAELTGDMFWNGLSLAKTATEHDFYRAVDEMFAIWWQSGLAPAPPEKTLFDNLQIEVTELD